jgi:actin-related protein
MPSQVLLTEPPLNPKSNREQLMKAMFETFGFAAVFIANTATLSLFSVGALTGIVIECGYVALPSLAANTPMPTCAAAGIVIECGYVALSFATFPHHSLGGSLHSRSGVGIHDVAGFGLKADHSM